MSARSARRALPAATIAVASLLAAPIAAVPAQNTEGTHDTRALLDRGFRPGGVGGLHYLLTRIDGRAALAFGAGGGASVRPWLVVGGAGYAFSVPSGRGRAPLAGGYGGVAVTYHRRPQRLVHLEAGLLAGAGAAARDTTGARARAFLVVQPSLGAALNVTRSLRVAVHGVYRFTGCRASPRPTGIS